MVFQLMFEIVNLVKVTIAIAPLPIFACCWFIFICRNCSLTLPPAPQAYFNGSYGEEIVKEHFSLIYEVSHTPPHRPHVPPLAPLKKIASSNLKPAAKIADACL
jgi:hypothetical protein